ncbi:hypothetical protein FIBSPDRAFT_881407 [Athelia psychrophila]|uniref:Uncharacterized protein n=1 Tax=Athelia psychrophila TaxID=1759441 RepID=A0A166WMX4_9AGAM|nr:hypothetical protein FIBSPDRAFT_881407 [Fibularhizoctonia sp. CBS 109695]
MATAERRQHHSSHDTKGLKGVVVNWITLKGQKSNLSHHIKSDHGFHNDCTGELLYPATWDWKDDEIRKGLDSRVLAVPGEHWPMFVYEGYTYDSTQPLLGLFKSVIPLSATRSGNMYINGMNEVTFASIAYVATMGSHQDERTETLVEYMSIKIFPGASVRGPPLTNTPLAQIRAILDEEEKAAAASATAA